MEPVESGSSSSSEDDDSSAPALVPVHRRPEKIVDESDDDNDLGSKAVSESESDSGSHSDDDDDNDLGSEAVSESESDSDDDDDDEDEESRPLQERLKHLEEQGSTALSQIRSRKAQALKKAQSLLRKTDVREDATTDDKTDSPASKPEKKKHRSKHAPTEASSKRKDFFLRGAPRLNESGIGVEIGAHRYQPQDPRVSDLAGTLNQDHFDHNYKFVDEIRQQEIQQLKERIKAHTTTGKKGKRMRRKLGLTTDSSSTLEEDRARLQAIQQDQSRVDRWRRDRAAELAVKRNLKKQQPSKPGSHPFYLKRREKKRLELEAKFEDLRKRGGDEAVEQAMKKKRRKNKSRDAAKFNG